MKSYSKVLVAGGVIPFPSNRFGDPKFILGICVYIGTLMRENSNIESADEAWLDHGNKCWLCRYMDKSVNHMLTHCGWAFRLWSLIFNFVWCFLGSSPFDKKNCCWDVIVPRGTRKASLLLMLDNLEEKIKMKGTSKVVDQS